MKWLRLLLAESKGYLENFIIPMLTVLMPWWLAIRYFRLIAYVPWLYDLSTRHRVAGVEKLGLLKGDRAAWIRACKVSQMVDLADMFLLFTRRDGYVQKYISDNFSPNLTDRQIIFIPHYGAGIWSFRLLARKKVPVAIFINRPVGKWRAADLSGRLRLWLLRREGVLVFDSENIYSLREALRSEKSIFVGPDMPRNPNVDSYQVPTTLGELNLNAGFFKLAENRNIAVVNAIFDLDVHSGKRFFDADCHRDLTAKQYAKKFAEKTAAAVADKSYLWQMAVQATAVIETSKAENESLDSK